MSSVQTEEFRQLVVIGASLGGLHAITELLHNVPGDFPAPIAFVQHRSASDPDTLVRLLRRVASLPVREPSDKEPILPGTLYVAPADYHLIVEEDGFALSTGPPVTFARPSIDVLFESAADAYAQGVVGVVLTGANHDGSAGAARIKTQGGRIIVQDPMTAECAVLPRSVLQSVVPDRVAPLRDIGSCLLEWCGYR